MRVKLGLASEAAIEAKKNDCIAAKWNHPNWTADYDQCPQHKKRDDKCYAIRDGWAYQSGLI